MSEYGLPEGVELPSLYGSSLSLREAFVAGAYDGFEGQKSLCNNMDWLWRHSATEEKAYAQGYQSGAQARAARSADELGEDAGTI